MNRLTIIVALASLLAIARSLVAQDAPDNHDTTQHSIRFVTVQDNVRLEVLDWGGSGRPMILLHGGNRTAHDFDTFAPKLTGAYHVYGITRRGCGASSAPEPTDANYTADRLGDDVLAVIRELGVDPPVLVGHSLGGQELSSIGSRHPERVSGLIYLDAAYQYAYYDRSKGFLDIDVNEVRRKLEQLEPGKRPLGPNELDRRAIADRPAGLRENVAADRGTIEECATATASFSPADSTSDAPDYGGDHERVTTLYRRSGFCARRLCV